MSKIIYLASFKANHPDHDIVYQDIDENRDIGGDMMSIDLSPYNIIIATPPCNYYSKLNRFRETAKYSQMTKHLLPEIIKKLEKQNKPFIVENVRSHIINDLIRSMNFNGFIYQHGRHTYWTNIPFSPKGIVQQFDFKATGIRGDGNIGILAKNKQGGSNVHQVLEYWLKVVDSYG